MGFGNLSNDQGLTKATVSQVKPQQDDVLDRSYATARQAMEPNSIFVSCSLLQVRATLCPTSAWIGYRGTFRNGAGKVSDLRPLIFRLKAHNTGSTWSFPETFLRPMGSLYLQERHHASLNYWQAVPTEFFRRYEWGSQHELFCTRVFVT